ncbi:hypothetical protein SeMB42_g01398 [Synchytrium endobioticum]|uniref:Mediator of RNA polymerase II transcription subunit 31 n=1 Tax=Synchytrium endobioticum TaxID=286115 RepID=A0A507DLK0_9FUNG|nr:hypothetical protein SeLEV6574_g01010 [Synchytrium endobioticum]TPX52493.1 hypothetical protein SeMB42_g01398 [Synchytrium endobioticum]
MTRGDPNTAEKTRFLAELEFVQCLANPDYLHYLAQQGYFGEPAFINYLKYLTYWSQPQYAKFIEYPYCLTMLNLLQDPIFRESLKHAQFKQTLHLSEHRHWSTWRNKREIERHGPMMPGVRSVVFGQEPGIVAADAVEQSSSDNVTNTNMDTS